MEKANCLTLTLHAGLPASLGVALQFVVAVF